MSRIAILGAGALGTSLAISLHKRDRTVSLWTIEPEVASTLRRGHENVKYLPGFRIPPSVHVTTELAEALEDADAAILAVPSHAVREVTRRLVPYIPDAAVLVSASRGLEETTWKRMTEVIAEEIPPDLPTPIVAMSGPCLAPEMARGSTAAVDAASLVMDAARRAKQALATPSFRVKPTNDVAGVEAGGALKNAFAVGAGIGDGLGWGMNERAVYLTKAIGEMARLGAALGGKRSTLYGLSGLGDLTVTAFSPHSRNRTLGEELAKGHSLREILAGMVSVAEGVPAARAAHAIAEAHHLRLPVTEALHAILHDGAEPKTLQKAIAVSR